MLFHRFPRVERLARKLISIYPLSARLGTEFWDWYAFFAESESWTPSALQDWQFERLGQVLAELAETSPFYSKRLSEAGSNRIRSIEEFSRLVPMLTRQEFSENYSSILSRKFRKRNSVPCSTSGTTGHALQFYHKSDDQRREWAAISHQWKRVGYDPVSSRRAEFRGLTEKGTLFQEYPDKNMVRFSILDLRAEALPEMAHIIRTRRLDFFHGYPSSLYLLAREVIGKGIKFPQPKAVLLASEMVYDFQVLEIQNAFPNAKLFAHYGCSERTALAAWCEHRRAYHVMPQYALVEVDPPTGEIIGTNLFNTDNGFVRYRMTDAAKAVEARPCPDCGRPYVPVIGSIEGRQEDYLYSPERGWISPAIVTYPLKNLHHVQELQFRQDEESLITINYVLRPHSAQDTVMEELTKIESGLRELTGNSTRLQLKRVEELPRGATGKYKWIVSRLSPLNTK